MRAYYSAPSRKRPHYYPIDRVPPFWDWLTDEGTNGHVKIPFEIYDEIASGNDMLAQWIAQRDTRDALVLDEEVDGDIFNRVLDQAYAPDLTDTELAEAGRDPFLVAYSLMGDERCVVTKEVSKPSKVRGRRKVPDACGIFGVPWMTDFRFYQARDFRVA